MKKTVSSIIAAVAIWAGTTAYVGSQMEENIQNQIKKSNTLYADIGLQYKVKNYTKSFLNSTVEVEINFTDPAMLELFKDSVKLPIVMKYDIEHGPLFIKNGLGFGAARTHQEIPVSTLLTKEAKEDFLKLIKNDIMVKSDMDISFTNNASYTLSTNEVKINDAGKSLYVSPLFLEGDTNLDTYAGDAKLNLHSLKFQEANSKNGLTVQDLKMDITIDKLLEQMLMLGTIDISAKNLTIKDDTNPQLENINIATDMHIVTKKDSETTIATKINGSIDLKDTKLPDNLPDLKNIQLKMDMQHIGLEGMLEFQKASKEMQKAQSKLLTKIQSNPSEEDMKKIFEELGTLQQDMMAKLVHSLNKLLVKDKTTIAYGVDIKTKDNKQSNANVTLGYTGDIKFDGKLEEIAVKAQQQLLNLFNLNLNIALDKEHIKTLPNAEILKQQIAMGVAQGFVKEENGKYILNGYYKNQELMVNDNNLTSTILPFLMMATQGQK